LVGGGPDAGPAHSIDATHRDASRSLNALSASNDFTVSTSAVHYLRRHEQDCPR
jgi:hypothetical protein